MLRSHQRGKCWCLDGAFAFAICSHYSAPVGHPGDTIHHESDLLQKLIVNPSTPP